MALRSGTIAKDPIAYDASVYGAEDRREPTKLMFMTHMLPKFSSLCNHGKFKRTQSFGNVLNSFHYSGGDFIEIRIEEKHIKL